METRVEVVKILDESMKNLVVVISEVKNSRDWKNILESIEKEKEASLKILIEVKTNFVVDEELDIKNYFDCYIKATTSDEASDIVDGFKSILNTKGIIKLDIKDLVDSGFKNEKEIFFKKIEGQNLKEIKEILEKIEVSKDEEKLVFSINKSIDEPFLSMISEVYTYIKDHFGVNHDNIMFSAGDEILKDVISVQIFFKNKV